MVTLQPRRHLARNPCRQHKFFDTSVPGSQSFILALFHASQLDRGITMFERSCRLSHFRARDIAPAAKPKTGMVDEFA